MKLLTSSSFHFAAIAAAALAASVSARAQTNAYDDAYHYAYASATWYTNYNTPPGINYGFGFTTWAVRTNGPAFHGFFSTRNGSPLPAISSPTNYSNLDTNLGPIGSPPGNNNSAHAWGLFANGTGLNSAVMFRGFSNSLDTTVTFKIDWENLGIGSTADNLGGFVLRNGNATNSTSDYTTGLRFAFYYIGGGMNSFVYWDSNSVNYIGIPFAASPLSCEFTLKSSDSYRFVVKSLTSGAVLAILDDQLLNGSGTIDSIALFANQTSGNQNFNRMQIISTSLVPPTILNALPTNGSIYVNPATDNVSFEVTASGANVRSTNVTLRLNGVLQTLSYNTTSPTTQIFATNTTPLALNQLYTATIVAIDDNSNPTTNTFSFNTFSPLNLCIDAEDYNYNEGLFFPNPTPNAYAGLYGSNGVDYVEVDPLGTNPATLYRSGDMPQILLVTGDPYDHAGFIGAGATDYELGYTDTGEWHNYTRNLANTNYTVYARAASGGGGTIMIERLANSTATSADQPRASLGTCIIPATGGSKTYSGPMIPLTDFFSNPVQIRFPGTNTLRERALNNRAYNLNYFIFVPTTNTATLRPYLSSGYPYPGAANVALESGVSFTIANRQTAVNPATIQLFLNSSNITGSISLSNNAAGSVVTYAPSSFLPPNTNNTLSVVFTDNDGSPVTITNTWQFTTADSTYTILPPADAQPIGSVTASGFAGRIYKIEDAAPNGVSLAFAELELAGLVTNTSTSQPYPNLANGGPNADGAFIETNILNYDITGLPTGAAAFPFKSGFPYVPTNTLNNNIALETLMYLQLTNGNYILTVRSDDGFRLTEGIAHTNRILGQFDGGRGNGTPTTMYITVLTNGLYPMRLLYFQAGSGGNLEFYTVNNGTPILVNDLTNSVAVKSFRTGATAPLAVTLLNPARAGSTMTFNFLSQAGHTHYVEYTGALNDAVWATLTTIIGNGSITNVVDAIGGTNRFYRVRTQ